MFYFDTTTSTRKYLLAGVAAASLMLTTSALHAADAVVDVPAAAPVAQPDNLWYVSIFGGAGFAHDYDADTTYSGTSGYQVNLDLDTGFILGLAIGREFGNNLRGEVEFAFQRNKIGTINYSSGGSFDSYSAEGDVDSYTILANLWRDFDPVGFGGAMPYVGGGIGVGIINNSGSYTDFPSYSFGDDYEAAFAFQLGAGASWNVSPNMAFDLGYRFKGILGVDTNDPNTGGGPATHDWDNLYTHNVLATLRFKLP